jgi:hypothetical protein
MPTELPAKEPDAPDPREGRSVLSYVLRRTDADLQAKGKERGFKGNPYPSLFSKYMSEGICLALQQRGFEETEFGERPSRAARSLKRLDVRYSTPEAGLGIGVSLKSVHSGEKDDEGNSGFTHNRKRNDEELRVEATEHHLRQPYAVMAAVVFLPFESCDDAGPTRLSASSFASWVEYLWPLRGRDEPEDAPDKYELVFVALYARDGSDLGFYQVGGSTGCPRRGRPVSLLTFSEFVSLLVEAYRVRNEQDFHFEGEGPER